MPKTILYNADDNTIIGHYLDGYKVDGKPQEVDPPIYELEVIDTLPPTYDPKLQNLTSTFDIDLINFTYTKLWVITNKTQEELKVELTLNNENQDQIIDNIELKKILSPLLTNIIGGDKLKYISLFNHWRLGLTVKVDETYQYNGKLYKVIQAHTTQIDWTPDIVPALFNKITPPGVIAEWKQPAGAHDVYKIDDQVNYGGFTWKSTAKDNVWAPGVYGWVKI